MHQTKECAVVQESETFSEFAVHKKSELTGACKKKSFGFIIFQFHLQVNASIDRQFDQAYRVDPNPISGITSSVDCLENITDQFAKVYDFCFSLMQ